MVYASLLQTPYWRGPSPPPAPIKKEENTTMTITLDPSVGEMIFDTCKRAAQIGLWAARNPRSVEESDGYWLALAEDPDAAVPDAVGILLSWNPAGLDLHKSSEGSAFWSECRSKGVNTREAILCKVSGASHEVRFTFNDAEVSLPPISNASASLEGIAVCLHAQWDDKMEANRLAYWTPERKAEAERKRIVAVKENSRREDALRTALAAYPFQIKEGMNDAWAEAKAMNSDPYGAAAYAYLEGWAALMSSHIAEGSSLPDCAKATSTTADVQGITGFMYGCAVQALSQFWVHGEELRRWHNLDTPPQGREYPPSGDA